MANGSAPGKIILFGEHAVVYGQPAIAVPISSLRAMVEISPSHTLTFLTPDFPIDNTDTLHHPLMPILTIITDAMGIELPPVQITIRSSIPVASGLGSGAAISTAMVRALSQFTGKSISESETNRIVYQTEQIHHGTPSGIDNTVIVYEKPIWFVSGKPIEKIENNHALYLLIADTGVAAPTKISVGDVRKLREQQPDRINALIEDIGKVVEESRNVMRSGMIVELGRLMTLNHTYLQQLTVSSNELDQLVSAAIQSGALGAKLSGGGRGGNMIALVTQETASTVESALRTSGAVRIYHNLVGAF